MPTTASVLGELLDPVITAEIAQRIVQLEADDATQSRLDELGEKANEGLLTPSERSEYEAYVTAIDVVGILQAKARRLLAEQSRP